MRDAIVVESEGSSNTKMAADTRPWWRRAVHRAFPSARLPVDEWPHGVTTYAVTHVSWKDRLRILVSGRVETVVRVDVEHDPGAIRQSRAVFSVVAPGDPR